MAPLEQLGVLAAETEDERVTRIAVEIETATRRADLVAQVYAHYISAYDCYVAIIVADLEECYRWVAGGGAIDTATATTHNRMVLASLPGTRRVRAWLLQATRLSARIGTSARR